MKNGRYFIISRDLFWSITPLLNIHIHVMMIYSIITFSTSCHTTGDIKLTVAVVLLLCMDILWWPVFKSYHMARSWWCHNELMWHVQYPSWLLCCILLTKCTNALMDTYIIALSKGGWQLFLLESMQVNRYA